MYDDLFILVTETAIPGGRKIEYVSRLTNDEFADEFDQGDREALAAGRVVRRKGSNADLRYVDLVAFHKARS